MSAADDDSSSSTNNDNTNEEEEEKETQQQQQQQQPQQQQLPIWTSDSKCKNATPEILSFRLGLAHAGGCLLFEPADFSLTSSAVTGLVGINGSGKTSLARSLRPLLAEFDASLTVQYLAATEEAVDDDALLSSNTTAGDDEAPTTTTTTPLDYLRAKVRSRLDSLQVRIEELEENTSTSDLEQVANQLAELYDLQEEIEARSEREIRGSLEALGFGPHLHKDLHQLSSGWRYKCLLVAAFLFHANLLIIDEPSFLDRAGLEWFTDKIRSASNNKSIVLLISHKERLMEACADRILYLNAATKTLSTYNCGYAEFRETLEAQRAHAARACAQTAAESQKAQQSLQNIRQALHKREGAFRQTTRQHADQRFIKGKNKEAKQKADHSAASKVKQLQRQVAAQQDTAYQARRERVKALQIDGVCAERTLAVLDQVGFRYGDDGSDGDGEPLLFSNVDAKLEPTDRVLLRGGNGCGKTTLVRLILGELEPTEGSITRHIGNRYMYFPQTALSDLVRHHGHRCAREYLRQQQQHLRGGGGSSSSGSLLCTETQLRQHLGNCGLAGDLALRPIAGLSAGQRLRLWLAAQSLALLTMDLGSSGTFRRDGKNKDNNNSNKLPCLLLLDEISENGDVETRVSLAELLNTFEGAVLVISHDADFCDSFQPTQIWTLHSSGLRIEYSNNTD